MEQQLNGLKAEQLKKLVYWYNPPRKSYYNTKAKRIDFLINIPEIVNNVQEIIDNIREISESLNETPRRSDQNTALPIPLPPPPQENLPTPQPSTSQDLSDVFIPETPPGSPDRFRPGTPPPIRTQTFIKNENKDIPKKKEILLPTPRKNIPVQKIKSGRKNKVF